MPRPLETTEHSSLGTAEELSTPLMGSVNPNKVDLRPREFGAGITESMFNAEMLWVHLFGAPSARFNAH